MVVNFAVNYEEGGQPLLSEGDEYEEIFGEFGAPPVDPKYSEALQQVPDYMNREVYDYGARVGFWRLIDLFERHDIKATFLCAGRALERHPESARAIGEKGHEAAGHGYTWRGVQGMKENEERALIRKAVKVIGKLTGERPYGWSNRHPRSENTDRLLAEEGFLYTSNAYADEVPYYVDVGRRMLLKIPYAPDVNDGRFWYPVGFGTSRDFFSLLKDTFDFMYAEGLRRNGGGIMSVGLHPRIIGRPGRTMALERFVQYMKGFSGVWIARRLDIAKWWLENFPFKK